jgi:hypothetical protein
LQHLSDFSKHQVSGNKGEVFAMPKEQTEIEELQQTLKKMPAVYQFITDIAEKINKFPLLFEIIRTDRGAVKYHCEKIVRICSESNPKLVYPYFDEIVEMMDSSNSFLKWGAITTLANLATVDQERRFDAIYERYFDLLNSESMITASNVVDNAWKIIRSFPEREPDITARLLAVQQNTYLNKGKPSPECRNIVLGNVLDCFSKYFAMSQCQDKMLEFAAAQLDNHRRTVAKRAAMFIKKFGGTN